MNSKPPSKPVRFIIKSAETRCFCSSIILIACMVNRLKEGWLYTSLNVGEKRFQMHI